METRGSSSFKRFPLDFFIEFFHSTSTYLHHATTHEPQPPAQSMADATVRLIVDDDRCYGCGACIMVCPVDALRLEGWLAVVEEPVCTLCDHCLPSCPVDALSMEALA